MNFADTLRTIRVERGLTQEGLARAAGTSLGNIRNYEQGLRLPTFPIVVKLAVALGTDCRTFAECDDVKNAEQPKAEHVKRPRGRPKA